MADLAIAIVAYNMDWLLSRQVGLLRRFCTDNHEVVVVNSSTNQAMAEKIRMSAEAMGCRYIRTAIHHGTGSQSHGDACNQSFAILKGQYRFHAYFDHDTFPVKPFSVERILDGVAMAGPPELKRSTTYLWPGCVMWDSTQVPSEMIDFSPNIELGLDTGGNLYKVLEKFGSPGVKFLAQRHKRHDSLVGLGHEFYSDIEDGTFMHFINYSNWANSPHHEARLLALINILEEKTK